MSAREMLFGEVEIVPRYQHLDIGAARALRDGLVKRLAGLKAISVKSVADIPALVQELSETGSERVRRLLAAEVTAPHRREVRRLKETALLVMALEQGSPAGRAAARRQAKTRKMQALL